MERIKEPLETADALRFLERAMEQFRRGEPFDALDELVQANKQLETKKTHLALAKLKIYIVADMNILALRFYTSGLERSKAL